MSVELLINISKILDYNKGEFRALSQSAQNDIESIRKGIDLELNPPTASNGQAGQAGMLLPLKKKRRKKK